MAMDASDSKPDDELETMEDEPEPQTEEKPEPAEPAAPRKRRWWLWLTIIFLVLVLAVVGLGWYTSVLQERVAALQAEVDTAQQQAGSLSTAASAVANELVPLAEESALVAKLRQASGDPEGAAGALHRAKEIADMARRLTPTGRPARLSEVEQQVADVEAALSSRGETEMPEEEADEAPQDAGDDEAAEEGAADDAVAAETTSPD